MTQQVKGIRIILTGATGMVGEGVLHECLQDPRIEKILIVGRRPCANKHPKIAELIVEDFFSLSAAEDQLVGYQGCLFCLGVSSLGMKESVYQKLTYDLTLHFAQTLCRLQPGMTFCYISGAGTDSTEKGRVMWARVKGKTENALLQLPFTNAYNFRPALLSPTPGLKNTLSFYRYLDWLFPVVRRLAPNT
ncbi:MAG: epimerase, partial [Chitinophagaceae bacterium]